MQAYRQGYNAKAFTQVNKKSMLYKRAMLTHSFDSMLREEEQKIMRDPKKMALYKLETREEDATSHKI